MDFTIAVPVIIALVEGFKRLGMDSKYAFLLAMGFGTVMFYFLADGDLGPRIFEGVVSGLSASGLYSGGKAMLTRK